MEEHKNITLKRVEARYPYFFYQNNFKEEFLARYILSKPENVEDESKLKKFLGEFYQPGTFILSEREQNPGFLFDEKIKDFEQWLVSKIDSEINMLIRNESLKKDIDEYGRNILAFDAKNIVKFKVDNKKRLCDCITNQEYSDVFRKIIIFLLRGNNYETFSLFDDFNFIGRKLSLQILEDTRGYTLYERLKQSISSGLIGLDLKDDITTTSELGENGIIPIKSYTSYHERFISTKMLLEKKVLQPLGIDAWKEYRNEVLDTEKAKLLTWMTDDYIPTIFEMKFIEEQLIYKKNLTVVIVPRRGFYSNDADYTHILTLLNEDLFTNLHSFYLQKRFKISKYGMDLGAFNGFRITKQLFELLEKTDVLVITGARSFEMAQGLNKNVYFSGIAVCRKYTESVTGINMQSGSSVFLKQVKKLPTFYNFKAREWRRFGVGKASFPVAEYTAKEYLETLRSGEYNYILSKFDFDEEAATSWILEQAEKNKLNILEIIKNVK